MRLLLLSLISIVISACAQEGPTGYRYGGGTESSVIETCKEDMFMDEWWDLTTNNIVANTLVPAYKDFCAYTSEDFVYYWDREEMVGYYDYDWKWHCSNKNTMKIANESSGEEIDMRIYGSVGNGCYDVKISYGPVTINGDLCSCGDTVPDTAP